MIFGYKNKYSAIEFLVPFGEVAEALAEGDLGREAEVALEGCGIGIRGGDIAGLHGDKLLVGLEIEVLGEHACTDELFLEDIDEVEKVLGLATTDIIYCVWGYGQSVLALLALGSALHDADNAFYDVIDISKVSAAVAVVEDLDGLALQQLVGEAEIGHIGSSGRTIDGEEAQSGAWDVVQLGIAVGHELVRFLRRGIEGDGVVDTVVGAERYFLVTAVD